MDEVMAGLNTEETKDIIAVVHKLARERNVAIGVIEHVMGVIRELTHRVLLWKPEKSSLKANTRIYPKIRVS